MEKITAAHQLRRWMMRYLISSELRLGSMLLAMALGLACAPGVMTSNPSWGMLIGLAPQPFWAALGLALAGLQIASHRYRATALRCACFTLAGMWWWALTVGQIYVWPRGAGLFVYGLLALLNMLSVYIVSTERLHRR